jgi:amidase
MGNAALRRAGWTCQADNPVGAKLRRAGFIVIGKSNMPEFGILPTTQPDAFGPTRNPWALDRSPAGSSGGSAVAVASRCVAVGHATDSGGSIRLPAAWCGLVGLKPSRGRTTIGPTVSRTVVENVVTRTVRDTAALLDALQGSLPGDLFALPPRHGPATSGPAPGGPGARLRVGILTGFPGVEPAPECVAGVHVAAGLLADSGCEVLPASLDLGNSDAAALKEKVDGCLAAYQLRRLSGLLGRPLEPGDVEPYTLAEAEQGRGISGAEYVELTTAQQDYVMRIAAEWDRQELDLLLTPTAPDRPQLTAELAPPPGDPNQLRATFRRLCAYTHVFNLTGQPAISLPVHMSGGLPVGVQLVGRVGAEDLLLQVAQRLEEATGWSRRRPGAADQLRLQSSS